MTTRFGRHFKPVKYAALLKHVEGLENCIRGILGYNGNTMEMIIQMNIYIETHVSLNKGLPELIF